LGHPSHFEVLGQFELPKDSLDVALLNLVEQVAHVEGARLYLFFGQSRLFD
jgi:hypothetical protein